VDTGGERTGECENAAKEGVTTFPASATMCGHVSTAFLCTAAPRAVRFSLCAAGRSAAGTDRTCPGRARAAGTSGRLGDGYRWDGRRSRGRMPRTEGPEKGAGCRCRRRTRRQPGLEPETARESGGGGAAGRRLQRLLFSVERAVRGQAGSARPVLSPCRSPGGWHSHDPVFVQLACITGPAGMQCHSAARGACMRGMRGRVGACVFSCCFPMAAYACPATHVRVGACPRRGS